MSRSRADWVGSLLGSASGISARARKHLTQICLIDVGSLSAQRGKQWGERTPVSGEGAQNNQLWG
jgi:hypothetical protein